MRFSCFPTTALLLVATNLPLTLQWSLPAEIRGIHSNLLNNDEKEKLLSSIKSYQQTAGDHMTVVGFLASCNESLIANPNIIQKMIAGISSLNDYLQDSGVQKELDAVLNTRLADNIAILASIQKQVSHHQGGDKRDSMLLPDMKLENLTKQFPLEETARYVKYAVAAYGDAVIKAANMDLHGEIDLRQGDWTKQRVAEHISIPKEDLHLVDVKYSGDATQLRHFLAIDHANQKVVLTIRGTFCASDATVDIVGYARPFCGGNAHAGISTMTERLWKLVQEDVLNALDENKGYELIITGHSLGAGTALLLNILLHEDERFSEVPFRTFAFASPPVYTPLEQVPEALQTAVNYMHDLDDVPYLSGDSIRHEVAALTAIDKACKDMDVVDKARLILAMEPPSDELVQKATAAFFRELPPKEGLPAFVSPAMAIAWSCENPRGTGKFDLKLCSPTLLSKSCIYVDPQSVLDHYPTRYEWVFTNIDAKATRIQSETTNGVST